LRSHSALFPLHLLTRDATHRRVPSILDLEEARHTDKRRRDTREIKRNIATANNNSSN